MYNLGTLKIQNLFSHKNTVVDFKQFVTTMIYGKNNDDEGCDSNGSGKSGILEGICIALTGDTFREDVTREEFINDEEKSCFISLSLVNPVLSKKILIERTFHRKASAENRLFINDEQITLVNDINQEIEKEIGISKTDLLKYFIIGEDNSKSFLTTTDSEKKKIISRFSKIDKLDIVLEKVNEDYKELKVIAEESIEEMNKIDSNIELINIQIQNEKKAALERIKKDGDTYDVLIKERQQELFSVKQQKSKNNQSLIILNKKIEGFLSVEEEIKKLRQLRREIEENKEKKEGQHQVLLNELVIYENKIKHEIVCPNCSHNFIVNEELSIEDIKKNITQLKVKIEKAKLEIEKYKQKKKLISQDVESFEEKQLEYKSLIQEKKHHLQEKQRTEESIQNIESVIQRLQREKLSKQKETLSNNKVLLSLNEQLKLKRSESEELNNFFQSEIEPKRAMFEYWLLHFSRKGFATYLANKVIKNIEGMINYSLNNYNINFSILINGFTRLKSGEIRDKIDVFILKDGFKPKKFSRLSSGEKARSNISTILALHKLINLSTDGRGLNFLGIDESFDKGLDFIGQKSSLEILEKSGVTTLLISHSNNDIGAKHKMFIEKTNDVSRVLNSIV